MQKTLKKSHVPGMYFRDCSLTRIMGHSWVNYGRHHSTRKHLAMDAPDGRAPARLPSGLHLAGEIRGRIHPRGMRFHPRPDLFRTGPPRARPNVKEGEPMAGEPILVVDDAPVDLKFMRLVLAHEGYAVRTAGSAEEAFEMLTGFRPELILADVRLPGMDGLEMTRR